MEGDESLEYWKRGWIKRIKADLERYTGDRKMIFPRIKLKCPKCDLEDILSIELLPTVPLGKALLVPWAYMCPDCYTHMDSERIEDEVVGTEK